MSTNRSPLHRANQPRRGQRREAGSGPAASRVPEGGQRAGDKLDFAGEELRSESPMARPRRRTPCRTTPPSTRSCASAPRPGGQKIFNQNLLETRRLQGRVRLNGRDLKVAKLTGEPFGVFRVVNNNAGEPPITHPGHGAAGGVQRRLLQVRGRVFRKFVGEAEGAAPPQGMTGTGVEGDDRNVRTSLSGARATQVRRPSSDEITSSSRSRRLRGEEAKLEQIALKKIAVHGHTGICAPPSPSTLE